MPAKTGSKKISTTGEDSGLTAKQIEVTAREVRKLYREFLEVTKKYILTDEKAKFGGKFDKATMEKDRVALESMIADEYKFVDAFGTVYDKRREIEKIMSSKINFEAFGTVEDNLQILSRDTAVTTGIFSIKGGMKVRYIKTGLVRHLDMSGEYYSTHTFKKQGNAWRVYASHISKVPEEQEKKLSH